MKSANLVDNSVNVTKYNNIYTDTTKLSSVSANMNDHITLNWDAFIYSDYIIAVFTTFRNSFHTQVNCHSLMTALKSS